MTGQPCKLKGAVRALADGSIRWTIITGQHDGDPDEWTSESVQIGGVTSASMGVLGIWTGAQHEKSDPLG
ncbi:uncharacterized protein LAESUDRAFT_773707, partial [Laetiporus sulphureus 93-53]